MKIDEEKAGAEWDKEGARMRVHACIHRVSTSQVDAYQCIKIQTRNTGEPAGPKAPRGPGRPGATGAPRGPGTRKANTEIG